MKTAYLDNNILIDTEKGEMSIEELLSIAGSQVDQFYFSQAHLYEAVEIREGKNSQRKEWIEQRVRTIDNLFQAKFLAIDNGKHSVKPKSSRDFIHHIYNSPFEITKMKEGLQNIFPQKLRPSIWELFDMDKKVTNNFDPNQLLNHLSKGSKAFGCSTFHELMVYFENMCHSKGYKNASKELLSIELLDALGFWEDRKTSKSGYARFMDGWHVYFATYCDFFITRDTNTFKKAQVVFEMFNHKTVAICPH